jgi:hypothetical protein
MVVQSGSDSATGIYQVHGDPDIKCIERNALHSVFDPKEHFFSLKYPSAYMIFTLPLVDGPTSTC